jgi:dihydrofolate reductase
VRNVIVSTFVTLDGVMEAPGGEDHPEGKGGWTFAHFTEAMGNEVHAGLQAADALLLGRVTWDHFAEAWPERAGTDPFADLMNSIPKYVVSSSGPEASKWNNSTVVGFDDIARLKSEGDGDLLVLGSADLAHALTARGLVDEYRLFTVPVLLGSGKRIFADGADTTTLKLHEPKTFGDVILLTYSAGIAPTSR